MSNLYQLIVKNPTQKHCLEIRNLLNSALVVAIFAFPSFVDKGRHVYQDEYITIEYDGMQSTLAVTAFLKRGPVRVLQVDSTGWVPIYKSGDWERYVQTQLFPPALKRAKESGLLGEIIPDFVPENYQPVNDTCFFSAAL